jgi:hypothetical protein
LQLSSLTLQKVFQTRVLKTHHKITRYTLSDLEY